MNLTADTRLSLRQEADDAQRRNEPGKRSICGRRELLTFHLMAGTDRIGSRFTLHNLVSSAKRVLATRILRKPT